MSDWKVYELGDVSKIYNGSTPTTNINEYWNGNIIWITPKDLSSQKSKYIEKGERNITEKGLSKVKSSLLPIGTILLSSRAPIGLLSIAKNEFVTNQGFKNIVVNQNVLNNEFLYYLLKIKIGELNQLGTGTTFKELSKTSLEKFKVSLPNLSVQQKIASILSALDDKIELTNRINDNLEAMAKTLYDYWFVQFDFPDENGKPYKSSGGKMMYNKTLKREIPEGWENRRLIEIANITMGQSPNGESYNEVQKGMIFFQGSTDFGWRFPENRVYTTAPTRYAIENDILLSVRAPIGTMNLAMYDCCIGRGLAALNSKDNFCSFLIYQMNYFKKKFDYLNSVGTTFGSLTKDDLYNLELAYPEKDILELFESKVSYFDSKIKNNSKQNQQLMQLRNWLLPMLMNGQVKVE